MLKVGQYSAAAFFSTTLWSQLLRKKKNGRMYKRQTERQTEKWIVMQIDSWTDTLTEGMADRQTNLQTERQTNKWIACK